MKEPLPEEVTFDSPHLTVTKKLVTSNKSSPVCQQSQSEKNLPFIPLDLLKSLMNNIINNAFKHKNGATRYTHIKVGRNKSHFTSDPLNGDNKYAANDICKMIEFLVDNIYLRFGGQLFRQMVGIPMGTNCAPLLADLFLYSYENEFLDKLIKEGKRKLARRFNLSYRYTDDLISFK